MRYSCTVAVQIHASTEAHIHLRSTPSGGLNIARVCGRLILVKAVRIAHGWSMSYLISRVERARERLRRASSTDHQVRDDDRSSAYRCEPMTWSIGHKRLGCCGDGWRPRRRADGADARWVRDRDEETWGPRQREGTVRARRRARRRWADGARRRARCRERYLCWYAHVGLLDPT